MIRINLIGDFKKKPWHKRLIEYISKKIRNIIGL